MPTGKPLGGVTKTPVIMMDYFVTIAAKLSILVAGRGPGCASVFYQQLWKVMKSWTDTF